jgi:hypothetical protein
MINNGRDILNFINLLFTFLAGTACTPASTFFTVTPDIPFTPYNNILFPLTFFTFNLYHYFIKLVIMKLSKIRLLIFVYPTFLFSINLTPEQINLVASVQPNIVVLDTCFETLEDQLLLTIPDSDFTLGCF